MSTIVTRAGKGSPLTWNEVDNNFTNLNTDKLQSGNTAAALTITSATINGGTITGTALNGTLGATTPSTAVVTSLTSSALTSGRVTFASTGGLLADSANMTFDGTNLSLLGSSTIIGAAANTYSELRFYDSVATGGTTRVRASGGTLQLITGNTVYATLDGVGNLGLGVTPSAWGATYKALQIGYGATISGRTASPQIYLASNAYVDSGTGNSTYISTNFASQYYQYLGAHVWQTAPSGTAGNAITFTQAMTLDSSSNLTVTGGATIQGLTVGKGGGAVATNTAVGYQAINATATGANNTAVGYQAAYSNTTGTNNSAFGRTSLYSNTTGSDNTAAGQGALELNSTGSYNTALGRYALAANTTASNNTALGYQAGYSNTGAPAAVSGSVFVGYQAGYSQTTPAYPNVIIGYEAGYYNQTGERNVLIGSGAGKGTASNSFNGNVCIGYAAGQLLTTGSNNTFVGSRGTASGDGAGWAITTGSKNTIIGGYGGNQGGLDIRTASNYIVLSDGDGNPRGFYDGADNSWAFPQMYVKTTASAANLFTDANGYIRRSTSALKYKTNVRDLPLTDINKFRPVVYNSKCENDDQAKDYFGIIADEVDEAGITELVTYGANGEVEGFQYERLTVVLLKTIQDLQARIEVLENK